MRTKTFLVILICAFTTINAQSQTTEKVEEKTKTIDYKNSIEFSPISPFIGIYGILYNYHLTSKDEFITGISYAKIHYDFGNTNTLALIIGYRRYLWRNLHIEYQIWPDYDNFYEKNEDKYYKSFDVWNEFRFGYQFNFKIMGNPFYTSIQWPFGFGLYASNKPQSFKDLEKENPFFYHFPLLFVGYKF